MKKSIKMLIITLVTILCFTSTSIVFAAGPSLTGAGEKSQNSSNSTTNISNTQDTQNIKTGTQSGQGSGSGSSNAEKKR